MNFSIIVLYELFDEGAVLVKDFITHVRDVMKNSLIFNLEDQRTPNFSSAHHTNIVRPCLVLCFVFVYHSVNNKHLPLQ